MHLLSENNRIYLEQAAFIAKHSCCLRAKCGAVVVKNGNVIGQGWNSPPGNVCVQKCLKDDLPNKFKSDKTCCIHAEDRAVRDALARAPDEIKGSQLFFIRLDRGAMQKAGKPYCTMCSKLALDVGIKEFVLLHENGITAYSSEEYNTLSFRHAE
ncbi:MAG TPA: hypothetical protein VLJ21_02565 [Candidatus Binatia bacterium]|nr:hypothetical protein [Candidatus Binatia bacterium]